MANCLQILIIIAETIFLSNETWRFEENKVKVKQRLIIEMSVLWQVAKSRLKMQLLIVSRSSFLEKKVT